MARILLFLFLIGQAAFSIGQAAALSGPVYGSGSQVFDSERSDGMFEGAFHSRFASVEDEQQSGIIVLGSAGRILHANPMAHRFAGLSSNDPRESVKESVPFRVPPLLQEFSERVAVQLEARIAAGQWTQFETKEIVRIDGREFLVRGFGIPDVFRRKQSRIVLTLQLLSARFST